MPTQSANTSAFPSQILCALDLEGRAGHAVNAAIWLSERLEAPVEIIHAFPPRPVLWGREEDMPEWVAGREATGRALRDSLRAIVADAPTELGLRTDAGKLRFHITAGHPVQVILEHARACRADLIVLGPHKKRGWLDVGSTARGVLGHAPRGVWVQPEAPRPVRRILAPVDLSPDSLHALSVARDLARVFGARVTVVLAFAPPVLGAPVRSSVPGAPDYVIDRMRHEEAAHFESVVGAFDWLGVAHEARFEQGDPAESVLALQDAHDLIVMGTHGRTGLSAAILGSVAHGVVRSSRIPVLALRYPRSAFVL
ncbi:MAG: universal stress protein [Planctomycetota bacterium]|nr:universal stress protein [Planctomycetota bacterium]